MRFFVLTFLLMVQSSLAAFAAEDCLSYTQVGDSNCQGVDSRVPEIALPTPAEPEVRVPEASAKNPAVEEKSEMDKKVDEFYETYGKPPREFVEFNLNPTLENALKWAKKSKELDDRNRQLTAAWGQAQVILKEMEAKGQEVPNYEALPDVPDYGVPLEGPYAAYANKPASSQDDLQGIAVKSLVTNGAPTPGFAANDQSFTGGLTGRNDSSVLRTGSTSLTDNGMRIVGDKPVPEGEVEIFYYFSAECPYCKKFEEGFKVFAETFKDSVEVTCVDMSPSERKRDNIYGKIDCKWRAAVPGEAKAMGIQSTPTLLIDRGLGAGLEKVEGLVDMGRLHDFVFEGRS